jgi:hypothetical protein
MKKLFSILTVAVIVLSLLLIPAPAAQAANIAPGDTVSVQFTFKDIYGISGEFAFSNPEFISGDVKYAWNTTMDGDVTGGFAFFTVKNMQTGTPESITITVSFKISANAKVGDQNSITFLYDVADQFGNTEYGEQVKTVTVDILSHPTQPTTKPTTKPTQATTKPTTKPTTQPTLPTTQPTAPTTQPTVPTVPTEPTVPTDPTTPTTPTAPAQQPCDRMHFDSVLPLILLIISLCVIICLLIAIIVILFIRLRNANKR